MESDVNREQYLTELVNRMRPWFVEVGLHLPSDIKVAVGFPLRGSTSVRRQTLGQCFAPSVSADGMTEIFITPMLGNALRVADVLLHELCHAAVGTEQGHGKVFRRAARALGLEGKPTATIAGRELTARLNGLLSEMGPYPHAELQLERHSSQSTRLLKAYCHICRYTVRVTRLWLKRAGPPICPTCWVQMREDMELEMQKPA